MRHTFSILVDNVPGVLSRISGLFSGRGFNIESLSVAETLDLTVSRMTIVTRGDDQILEQIAKQLNKLVNVIKVLDVTEGEFVEREMALIKVSVNDTTRSEILGIVDIFRAKVVDVCPTSYTIEITGNEEKIKAILDLFRPMGILEVARTGKAALSRGNKKERAQKKKKEYEPEKVEGENNG
jgi:acetolactate synthase-1/3 small subunit